MKTQLHTQNESIAGCIIALINWRQAVRAVNMRPTPEAKHWERECYRALELYPDAVQKAADLMVHRRAA